MGFVMFEGERMMVAGCDGRLELPPDAPARALYAYNGRYRFDGTELVTTVDSTSSPDRLSGEQIRQIRFESPTRMVATSKTTALGQSAVMQFVWERVGG
jgi:hypothetical protein